MSERENAGFTPNELKIIADAFTEAKVEVERKRGPQADLDASLASYLIAIAQGDRLDQYVLVSRAVRFFTVLN